MKETRKPPFVVESIGIPEFPPDSVEIFQVLDGMANAMCDCINEEDAKLIVEALNKMRL